MKKSYIVTLVLAVCIIGGGIFLFLSKDADNEILVDNTEIDNSSGVVSNGDSDDSDISSGQEITPDSREITLTFDEGCMSDEYYYVDRDNALTTAEDWMMNTMQSTKCRSKQLDNNTYSTGVQDQSLSGESGDQVDGDTPIYMYTYVYSKNADFNNQAYILLKSGEKISPSIKSVINDDEAYLIFEVKEGYEQVDKVVLETDTETYNLSDVDAFGCGEGDCAY